MKILYYIALTLVIIGAINWLLIGLFVVQDVHGICSNHQLFVSSVTLSG